MILSRTELNKKFDLNKNMWQRRKEDLLEYLNEFMTITEIENNGRYSYEIDVLPDSIPPFPRKSNKENKIQDYKKFTIAALGNEFKPNSKSKIARDAINDFGLERYGHTSTPYIVRSFVGPVMEENGEHSHDMVWVDSNTYELISDEQKSFLCSSFEEVHLSEKEMANAFVKEQQGEDISDEKSSYSKVMDRFKEKYDFRPIKVYKWKIKS